MAIERTTHLYEILFRFGPEGLVGCHAIEIERVKDNDSGELLAERQLPARPISSKEATTLIGTQKTALIEQVAALQEQVTGLSAERAERRFAMGRPTREDERR